MERKTQFSIGYFLLVFFALLLLQNYFFMRHVQDISYSEFRKLVQEGKVDDLVISSNIIRGKMREGASDIISAMRGDPSLKEHFGKMKEEGHSFSTGNSVYGSTGEYLVQNDPLMDCPYAHLLRNLGFFL
jgi:hypothetical protein